MQSLLTLERSDLQSAFTVESLKYTKQSPQELQDLPDPTY
jgi:hypothetical protein